MIINNSKIIARTLNINYKNKYLTIMKLILIHKKDLFLIKTKIRLFLKLNSKIIIQIRILINTNPKTKHPWTKHMKWQMMIKTHIQKITRVINHSCLGNCRRITSWIGRIVSMKSLIDMLEEVDPFQVLVSVLILLVTIESNQCFKRMKIIDNFQLTRKVIRIINININDKN
jgi:hypothetical protein